MTTTTRALVGLALLALIFPLPAPAQRGRCLTADEPLTLARLTWHEEGVDRLAGAAALNDALTTLADARGLSWSENVCAYSGRLFRGLTRRAPWLLALRHDETQPRGFPASASWEREGPRWSALIAEARAIRAGLRESPCAEPPTDWGSPRVDAARIRRGEWSGWWRRVDCGPDVRNVYLRRTHLDSGPD